MSNPVFRRRWLLGSLAAVALVVATAVPASAHIRVSSPDAVAGGEAGKIVFRVPTESATASTTEVSVALPTRTPFAYVSAMPKDGWTVRSTTTKLAEPVNTGGFTLTKAVTRVTWTATPGHGLKPGEFDEFSLSVGPFPDKPTTIRMPATQTYSDGTVVTWDDPTPASGKEPEHPVPALAVGPASTPAPSDRTARWLGGAGLLLGAIALGVAGLGRRRTAGAAG